MDPKFCPLNTSFHFWLTSVVLTVQGDSFDWNGKGHSVFFQVSTGLVCALWASESTCSPVRRSSETVVTFPRGVSEHLPPCLSRWACAHWDRAQTSAHHSFFLRIFGALLPLEQPSTLSLGIPYLTATRVFIPNLFFIVSLLRPLPKLGWLLRLHIDNSLSSCHFLFWTFPGFSGLMTPRCWWGCPAVLGLLCSGASCWLYYSFLISKSMYQPAGLLDGCACVVL